jgi:hypothetical protein
MSKRRPHLLAFFFLAPPLAVCAAHSVAAANWQASWFGPWPGHPEWADAMNEGKPNASGAPMTTPGIALYDKATLGKWFVVWNAEGKHFVLPQVDVGPAPWTGKTIDINAPAAARMGYTPQTFPTGAEFPYRRATQEEITNAAAPGMMPGPVPRREWANPIDIPTDPSPGLFFITSK